MKFCDRDGRLRRKDINYVKQSEDPIMSQSRFYVSAAVLYRIFISASTLKMLSHLPTGSILVSAMVLKIMKTSGGI